ncbi:MAG: hypothetical protein ACFB5Z_05365 [Elainellaceae cyanobacterium]
MVVERCPPANFLEASAPEANAPEANAPEASFPEAIGQTPEEAKSIR